MVRAEVRLKADQYLALAVSKYLSEGLRPQEISSICESVANKFVVDKKVKKLTTTAKERGAIYEVNGNVIKASFR